MHYRYLGEAKNKSLYIDLTTSEMNLIIGKMKHMYEANLSRDDMVETVKMFLTFDLSSYKDYKESDDSGWRDKFYDAERIMGVLTEEQGAALATTLVLGHIAIKEAMDFLLVDEKQTKVLHNLNAYISKSILQLDSEIGLFEKIHSYTKTLNPPVTDDFGKREQDSPEYTFNKEEVNTVSAIVLTAKIFMPLFTTMLKMSKEPSARTSTYGDRNSPVKSRAKLIDKRIKEIYCLSFIEPLFFEHIEPLYTKLMNYMEKFIEVAKSDPTKQNSTQIFRNNSVEELLKIASSYILCRRCVKYNLSSPLTNIMGFIWKGAKNVDQLAGSDAVYFPRLNFSSEESPSTKESILELGSTKSKILGDEEPYVMMTALRTLEDRILRYGLDRNFFDEVLEYNLNIHKEIEPFMEMILNNAFSEDFESCYCIKSLFYIDMIKLLTLVQIICITKGWNELAHRIFAVRKVTDGKYELRDQLNDLEGGRMRYNTGSFAANILDELKSCYTKTLTDDKKLTSIYEEGRRSIENVAKYFTDYESYYRTAPGILSHMKIKSLEGKLVVTTPLIDQFCKVLEGL